MSAHELTLAVHGMSITTAVPCAYPERGRQSHPSTPYFFTGELGSDCISVALVRKEVSAMGRMTISNTVGHQWSKINPHVDTTGVIIHHFGVQASLWSPADYSGTLYKRGANQRLCAAHILTSAVSADFSCTYSVYVYHTMYLCTYMSSGSG